MEKLRLDKLISQQLNISRTDAKKLIRQGHVCVNGKPSVSADLSVVPSADTVTVQGKPVQYKKHIYLMMNKPQGVVSASDGKGEKTVVDLVPEQFRRNGLFPAGRLDKDTTGFVLITDDGEFAHNILSPSKHIAKTYLVTLKREVTEDERVTMLNGMMLGDVLLKPAYLQKTLTPKRYTIQLTQGLYHQIKRMFKATGNEVTALHRLAMGGVELDKKLKPGECRELSENELLLIRKNDIQ